METIDFEQLGYGVYQLDSEEFVTENVRYATSDFNRLYVRKVRLPDGKGNLIFLLSNTFAAGISMIKNKRFIMPNGYRKMWYPIMMTGSFLNKRYRKYVNAKDKASHDQMIKDVKLRTHPTRSLKKVNENMIVNLGDLYESIQPILRTKPLKQVYTNFWKEFVSICDQMTYEVNDKSYRVLIIDCDSFGWTGSKLEDAKSNPLYLLYIAYLRNRDLSKLNVDIDMMICGNNTFMKFNPAKLDIKQWGVFRRGLFRIMKSDLDAFTDTLSSEEKEEIQDTLKDASLTSVVNDVITAYTKNVSSGTKAVVQDVVEEKLRKTAARKLELDAEIKKAVPEIKSEPLKAKSFEDFMMRRGTITSANPIKKPLTAAQEKLFKQVATGYEKLTSDTGIEFDDDNYDDEYDDSMYSDDEEEILASDAQEILTNDDDVKDAILTALQDKVEPKPNTKSSQANSARDEKLRAEQKKVMVKNSTIEQLLEQDSDNIPIKEEDKSSVMHTANQNMKHIRFANFEKSYIDNLYYKDIVACFDMLKDKDSPFYITNIDIKDTSTALDFKETWTVSMKDEFGKRHTMKVDIPRFKDNKFMLINGTKYMILKQNFYKPLVKDTPDTVILTTNYNKITITRKATKSLSTIERLFTLIKKVNDPDIFVTGDSSQANRKYISCLEYDEISRHLFKFKSGNTELCFSRTWIDDNWSDKIPSNIKKDEFYIGYEGEAPVLINEDTGRDAAGRSIVDIIVASLPSDIQSQFNAIKGPTQTMYVEAKMAGEFIPVVTALIIWNGLKKSLDMMGTEWEFIPGSKRPGHGQKYIRFADGYLTYKPEIFSELILNGLIKMHPEQFGFDEFESEAGYEEFMHAQWGSYAGITEIKAFNEFLIDPITKAVCHDINLPDTPSGLLIHAVKMLCDNAFNSKASDKSYRVRSIEIVPAILYSAIAIQYKKYIKSGRRIPFTLNQRCVMGWLKSGVGIETYSTLNPVVEVNKASTISAKGYKGTNKDRSYDESKRSYDPTSVGKIAISTSADANVGINRQMVLEPLITNTRGFRDPLPDEGTEDREAALEQLKDVNVFSATEMLTPGTARGDDPIRTAIAGKQSQHIVPVQDAVPALISNGFDEAVQFQLSDDFVINAEEDGKVVEVNDELGFIVVEYKSGKHKAISTNPEVVKNSGAGFYLSNALTATHTKVGEKFKKDEPLAYHPRYFKYSKLNGLRFSIGPLCKMAVMSSYNTYEDAGICTESLANRMKTSIVYLESGKFKKNNNILSMVNVGDHVNIGDALIKFDVSSEDNELAKLLTKLNDDNRAILEEEAKSEIKTMHAGKVIAIKVYTILPPESLSPSLGEVVKKFWDSANSKKDFLNKYDSMNKTMKAGYLLTDETEPVKEEYNTIKGQKGIDVLIEIYIEHDDVMGVGDKIALYGPNKQIISQVIPKGYEPYSEFRPNEEISVLTSPGTVARRMTSSVLPIALTMKVMVELKRKIADTIKYK